MEIGAGILIEGRPQADSVDKLPLSKVEAVTVDYFRTLGILLIQGRGFTEQDNPEPTNLFPANRIELGLGSEQQPVAGDRWCGQRHLVLRIDAQRLERRAGFHDVRRAFLVQAKDLAVIRPRRRGECPAAAIARQPALVTLFARLRVESCKDAHFVEYV